MSISLVVIAVVLVIVFLIRSIAIRRRQMITRLNEEIVQSIQSSTANSSAGLDIGQGIAQAVQKAVAEQGLGVGNVSVTTNRSADNGAVAAASGSARDADVTDLGVGDVLSVSSLSGAPIATVELDAIGEPRRRVTIDLPAGSTITRGDRIYVRLDPNDAATATLVPGLAPPSTGNRLDPLVLQPMLLARGEQGKGVVRTAEALPLPPGAPMAGAMSSWRLELEVTPRSGFPYRGEIVTTVSTVEKAARICHAGAEVPIRYDPANPKTIAIDGPAMGFTSPAPAMAALDTSGFAAMGIIERIKSAREQTGMSLKDAKDLVEGLSADPTGFAQQPGARRAGRNAQVSVDWPSLANLSKVQKISAVREQTGIGLAQAKALVEAMEGLGPGMTATATERMTAMLSGRK